MSQTLNEQIEALRHLTLSVRRQLESAEAYVTGINEVVRQLVEIELIEPTILLGDIVHEARYNPRLGREDSTRILQAALGCGHGDIGAVIWDSEQYWEFLRRNEPPNCEVELNFTPFDECPSAVKGLLLPQMQPLVTRLAELVGA